MAVSRRDTRAPQRRLLTWLNRFACVPVYDDDMLAWLKRRLGVPFLAGLNLVPGCLHALYEENRGQGPHGFCFRVQSIVLGNRGSGQAWRQSW